jgi:hypothetical protein
MARWQVVRPGAWPVWRQPMPAPEPAQDRDGRDTKATQSPASATRVVTWFVAITATHSTPNGRAVRRTERNCSPATNLRPVAAPSTASIVVAVEQLPVGAGTGRARASSAWQQGRGSPGDGSLPSRRLGAVPPGTSGRRHRRLCDLGEPCCYALTQRNGPGLLTRCGCGLGPVRRARACVGGAGCARGCPRELPRPPCRWPAR